MISLALVLSSIVTVDSASAPSDTTLKMEGKPGIKIFGFCTSTEGPEEKKFDGVTPTKVHFDTTISRCKVSSEGQAAKFKVRVFQNRQYVTQKELHSPSSGIEIVIPLGKKKK